MPDQYGRPGRNAAKWGPDTIEGNLSDEELAANRQDQTIDNAKSRFRDEDYYSSKEFDLADVKVPLLSVANWGGILLHLRGNVQGYLHAGSELKYLRFITGSRSILELQSLLPFADRCTYIFRARSSILLR